MIAQSAGLTTAARTRTSNLVVADLGLVDVPCLQDLG
jgi:hypothetical protein